MYDASKQIVSEFKDQKSAIELFIIILMRLTAFSFLFIILGYLTINLEYNLIDLSRFSSVNSKSKELDRSYDEGLEEILKFELCIESLRLEKNCVARSVPAPAE